LAVDLMRAMTAVITPLQAMLRRGHNCLVICSDVCPVPTAARPQGEPLASRRTARQLTIGKPRWP